MADLTLRACVAEDLPTLMVLGAKYHEENGNADFPLSPQKALRVAYLRILEGLAFGVENNEGVLVGAMFLSIEEPWWSEAKGYFESGFFVDKDWRKSTHAGDLLIEAAKAMAQDAGLPLIATPQTSADADRKDAWFRKRGFSRLGGGWYRWRPEP